MRVSEMEFHETNTGMAWYLDNSGGENREKAKTTEAAEKPDIYFLSSDRRGYAIHYKIVLHASDTATTFAGCCGNLFF